VSYHIRMSIKITAWPTGQHEEVRARIAAHRAADEIVQGTGWRGGQGCAVGCSLDRYDHREYARVLGVPIQIAHVIDTIHEGLPLPMALDWPGRIASALTPGTVTTHAWSRWVIWLLREECQSSVGEEVAALYERRIAGDEPSATEWRTASTMARESEERAARAAWAAAAARAEAEERTAWSAAAARAAAAVAEAEVARAARSVADARAAAEAEAEAEEAWSAADAARAEAEASGPRAAADSYARQADALVRILATQQVPATP